MNQETQRPCVVCGKTTLRNWQGPYRRVPCCQGTCRGTFLVAVDKAISDLSVRFRVVREASDA